MSSLPPDDLTAARGIVRLLNTTGGRVLCLAGAVDAAAVDAFRRRYGPEPAPVDAIEAGSVTSLSEPGLDLLLDHLHVAGLAGRSIRIRRSPHVERLLTGADAGAGSGAGSPGRRPDADGPAVRPGVAEGGTDRPPA